MEVDGQMPMLQEEGASTVFNPTRTYKSLTSKDSYVPCTLAQVSHLKEEKSRAIKFHANKILFAMEQKKRQSFYAELIIYSVFLSILLFTVCTLPIHFPFEQTEALQDLFVDEELANETIFKKSFHDAMNREELWHWIQGPLYRGYYESPLVYGKYITPMQIRAHYIPGENVNPGYGYPAFTQYKQFSSEDDIIDINAAKLGQYFRYSTDLDVLLRSFTFTSTIWNTEQSYGKSGYVMYLPQDEKEIAKERLQQLRDGDFLRPETRYVVFNFALYNPSSELISMLQFLIEFSNTDYIEKTARITTFPLVTAPWSSNNSQDNPVSILFSSHGLVLLLFLITMVLLVRELIDLKQNGFSKYISSFWNTLDIVQLGLLITSMVVWVQYMLDSGNFIQRMVQRDLSTCDLPQNIESCFINFQPLAFTTLKLRNLAGTVSLISVAIVFKYLRLNARMNLLWRTLQFAAYDLLAFVLLFMTIFFGYAVMGFLLFGAHVRTYHSLSSSMAACFQMLLGAFDYEPMYQSNPRMSGIFFFTFMISVYLIIINMFIAIMSQYYSIAQEEKALEEAQRKEILEKDPNFEEKYFKVEYDILKQFLSYWNGLLLTLEKPTSNTSVSFPQKLHQNQRVLLLDAAYIRAERKRLIAKFKAAVRVVIICCKFLNPLGRFFYDFRVSDIAASIFANEDDIEHRLSVRSSVRDTLQRKPSSIIVPPMAFPVNYIAATCKSIPAFDAISSLSKGDILYIEDNCGIRERITLRVLGDQSAYLNGMIHLQNHETGLFGLNHQHTLYEERLHVSNTHIRTCSVELQDQDGVQLVGNEKFKLSFRFWVNYLAQEIYSALTRLLTTCCCTRKSRVSYLLSDADLELLLQKYVRSLGPEYQTQMDVSIRYDELARLLRLHVINAYPSLAGIDEKVKAEIQGIASDRFPHSWKPLDKREMEGYKYIPRPIDTSTIRLPHTVTNELHELLAVNMHEVWAKSRIKQGWSYGPYRNNEHMKHPNLVPYAVLSESDRQYDIQTSLETLKVIQALNYRLIKNDTADVGKTLSILRKQQSSCRDKEHYKPTPIDTSNTKIPRELKELIELLAENSHELWAKMRFDQGWSYGSDRNDAKKKHDGFVPYIYLTDDEKQIDRY